MFWGTHSHSMDTKGRVSIPAEFRMEIQHRSEHAPFITKDKECLVLYPYEDWMLFMERLESQSPLQREARLLRRYLAAGAARVPFDSQGRILIPQHLRKHAKLEREVVVAGIGSLIELWNKDLYDADNEDIYNRFDELSSKAADSER